MTNMAKGTIKEYLKLSFAHSKSSLHVNTWFPFICLSGDQSNISIFHWYYFGESVRRGKTICLLSQVEMHQPENLNNNKKKFM